MRVLIISTDESAFFKESDTRLRFESYARAIGEVYFIVVSRERHETIHIDGGSMIVCASGILRLLGLLRAYIIGSRMKGVEVVSAQDPFEQGIVGWLIARRLKVKLHLQVHTDIGSPYFAEATKNKIRVYTARFLLPRANAIRTVSERVKMAVVRQFHAPLHLVSVLPVRRAEKYERCATRSNIKGAFPQYDSVVLVISRLTPEKNIGLALEAFSMVAKSHPKTGLVILGDGPEKETLARTAVALGIDTQVQFMGFLGDVDGYLATADVYLLTSDYEGYGRTLIEAAGSGCPIVTTDVGLVGSILTKEEALICPPRNAKCLATHLALLLENPKLGAHLAATAQKIALPILHEEDRVYLTRYRDDLARALSS